MTYKIAIADAYRLGQLDFDYERSLLKDIDAELSVHHCHTKKEIIEELKYKDILCVALLNIDAEVISQLTCCKAIIRYGIGVDMIDREAAAQRGILVCNEPDYAVDDVALHIVTLMLNLTKKICFLDKEIRRGSWDFQAGYPVHRLTGKTVGFIGFGHIAKRAKEYLTPFGMKYLALSPSLNEKTAKNNGVRRVSSLKELLTSADFVSINCPLNDQTWHMLGKEQFEQMRSSSFIINTSRGAIINQKDLVQALERKMIRGAALDVFEEEPLESTDALCKLENVILTPHSAFYSEQSILQLRNSIINQAISVIRGDKPKNLITD